MTSMDPAYRQRLDAYIDLICGGGEVRSDDEAMLVAEIIRLRAGLKAIAEGKKPCLDCGNVHTCQMVYRVVIDPKTKKDSSGEGPSWAAPDGHAYRKMSAEQFAAEAL